MRGRNLKLQGAALLLFAAFFLSNFPYFPLRNGEQITDSLDGFLSFAIEQPIFWTMLERCVLLVPLGYLVARLLQERSARHLVSGLVLAGALIALALEASQLPFASRHVRYSDALMAFWSFLAGAVTGLIHAGAGHALIRKAVLTGIGAVALLAGFGLAMGPSTANWSCAFPVLAGDEQGGGRPWRGSIGGIALYPRALEAATVHVLSRQPFTPAEKSVREKLGAAFVYSGEPDRPIELGREGIGAGSLPLFDGPPKDRFCEAVRRAHAVTVELNVKPDSLQQRGPARILSYSKSLLERNFTIAQSGSAYDFRLRTWASGANGEQFPIKSGSGTVALRWQRVTATYAAGEANLFIDGQRAAGPVRFSALVTSSPQYAAPNFMLYLSLASGAGVLLWLSRRKA